MRHRLRLRTGCDEIRRGHPWIFRDADVRSLKARTGDVVEVRDARTGAFLATGIFDSESSLAIRILSFREGEEPDLALITRRLEAAVRHRERFIDTAATTAWRIVNGEGDGLPGLVADRYGDFAVIQPYATLWLPFLPAIADWIADRLGLRGVALRSRVRRVEDDVEESGLPEALAGERLPDELVILEHGLRFLAHTRSGRKTGLFLDQRDNRLAVAPFTRGKRVLNTFSYTGGFSVYAARAEATSTVNVDLSRGSAGAARRNFELNGFDPGNHEFVVADVFEWLAGASRSSFDVVILDPPSFATSRRQVFSAKKSYERLIAAACPQVTPGGILVLCSCTAQISLDAFVEAVADATWKDAGRVLRILEIRGLPADHPTMPGFPEGRYLKCVIGVLE